jgi:hypothetical protein
MNLSQWAAKQPYRVEWFDYRNVAVIPDQNIVDRWAAFHLEDFTVSSVTGGSIWFVRRKEKRP